jgi:hypothetical protein
MPAVGFFDDFYSFRPGHVRDFVVTGHSDGCVHISFKEWVVLASRRESF